MFYFIHKCEFQKALNSCINQAFVLDINVKKMVQEKGQT